ncbi:hypothetical protein K3177_14750 [Qipengyuania sp. GH25]|uniref:DUF2384 domain-containing protein n=1 Tax=Qipengyuania pacifica TaxID=2860199 RepID=A0ABS7JK50_9SPHN|nr:hypothetical protein [Qipengyuania aerophila]MBX7489765.1 hypothetical protein [Qipengyuania aerophila]
MSNEGQSGSELLRFARREFEVMLEELAVKAADCGLSEVELRQLIGRWPVRACVRNALTEKTARQLHATLSLLRHGMGEDAKVWLRSPEALGIGVSPLRAMLEEPKLIGEICSAVERSTYRN